MCIDIHHLHEFLFINYKYRIAGLFPKVQIFPSGEF